MRTPPHHNPPDGVAVDPGWASQPDFATLLVSGVACPLAMFRKRLWVDLGLLWPRPADRRVIIDGLDFTGRARV
jgi:hypothetical protein